MDEQGGITTVVHNQVGAVAAWPGQGLLSAPPVLLQGLALPGEARSGVAGDGGSGVVLGGEDVAAAPADLSAQSGQGLNEHTGLDGHVQGAADLAALERLSGAELGAAGHQTRHLSLGQLQLQVYAGGKGQG